MRACAGTGREGARRRAPAVSSAVTCTTRGIQQHVCYISGNPTLSGARIGAASLYLRLSGSATTVSITFACSLSWPSSIAYHFLASLAHLCVAWTLEDRLSNQKYVVSGAVTYSACAAATAAASAASCPRSLQYPSSSPRAHISRAMSTACRPLIDPFCHVRNRAYSSAIFSSRSSDLLDSSSESEQTLHWHVNPYWADRICLQNEAFMNN